MQKLEREKIDLIPLNLDQIRLSGQLLGSLQNKSLNLNADQLRYLELLQKGTSIQGISQDFLKHGKLISFQQLKDLLQFLITEKMIKNPSFIKYFQAHVNSAEKQPGLFDKLFKQAPSGAPVEEKIKGLPFFRSLPKDVVQLFLANQKVIDTPAGIKVCEAGGLQRSLLCVLEGSLSIYKKDSAGKVKKTADLEAGSIFGEAGFFLNQARTADVITDTPCKIVRFKYVPEIFDPLIQKEKVQSLQKRIWLIHALLASDLFKALPDDCFDSLIYAGDLKSLKAGTTVFSEGQKAQSFFIIIQGSLDISQKQKSLRKLSQGDCFGEIALLLTGGLRTASVTAETEALLLEISADKFYQLLGDNLLMACEFEKLSIARVQADQKRTDA